jgi:hypothetical protein
VQKILATGDAEKLYIGNKGTPNGAKIGCHECTVSIMVDERIILYTYSTQIYTYSMECTIFSRKS